MPHAILNVCNGQIFDNSVKSLIHLGVYKLRLFQEDLKGERMDESKFHLLGRPAIPAIYLESFKKLARAASKDGLKKSKMLSKFLVMKKWERSNNEIECEDI